MKASRLARLEQIETAMRMDAAQDVWVSMFNTRVLLLKDSGAHRQKRTSIDFPSVKEAAEWVDEQTKDSEKITGMIHVDDFTELFEGEIREALQAAMMPLVPLLTNGNKNMTFGPEQRCAHANLAYMHRVKPFPPTSRIMFMAWLHTNPDHLTFRGPVKFLLLHAIATQVFNLEFPKISMDGYNRLFEGHEMLAPDPFELVKRSIGE